MNVEIVESTCDRLNRAFAKSSLKQADLVKLTGIDKSSISLYLSGKVTPKGDKLYKLAMALNVSPVWLSGFDVPISESDTNNEEKPSPRKGIKIPVLGYVKAGVPMEAVENIIDYEEIPLEMSRTGEYFGLKVKGDSMEPRILEGDVVIVRKQETVENGETAVVLVNGDEATVKRFYRSAMGVSLISTNNKYDPFNFSPEEVEQLPVRVIGKVVELRGKF